MSPRILIIEDDNELLDILKFTFEREGYEILGAKQPQQALNILALAPSIVVLDVRRFGSQKTGEMLCKSLKSDVSTRHIPVLLLSAHHCLAVLAKQCGADGFLVKPFDIDELKTTVNSYIIAELGPTETSRLDTCNDVTSIDYPEHRRDH